MGTLLDEVGNRYGKLIVLERSGSTVNGQANWLCECDCGKTIVVAGPTLRKGYGKSCGCLGGRIPGRRIMLRGMNQKDKDIYLKYISKKRAEYGISEDGLRDLMDNQKGMCAICKATLVFGKNGGSHVDHNHSTGEVRGYLCVSCNWGLGSFQDSHDILIRAATYLMTKGGSQDETLDHKGRGKSLL